MTRPLGKIVPHLSQTAGKLSGCPVEYGADATISGMLPVARTCWGRIWRRTFRTHGDVACPETMRTADDADAGDLKCRPIADKRAAAAPCQIRRSVRAELTGRPQYTP